MKRWQVAIAVLITIAATSLALALGYAVTTGDQRSEDNRNLIKQTRTEQCTNIDADHNRERFRLVEGQAILYKLPEFKALIASPAAEKVAYDLAKVRYVQVRSTRPPYCTKLVGLNAVKPYPPLSAFQDGRIKLDPKNNTFIIRKH